MPYLQVYAKDENLTEKVGGIIQNTLLQHARKSLSNKAKLSLVQLPIRPFSYTRDAFGPVLRNETLPATDWHYTLITVLITIGMNFCLYPFHSMKANEAHPVKLKTEDEVPLKIMGLILSDFPGDDACPSPIHLNLPLSTQKSTSL